MRAEETDSWIVATSRRRSRFDRHRRRGVAPLPRRPYKDGIELSIIAFGGIVVCGLSQKEASHRVAEAYDRGLNYSTAPRRTSMVKPKSNSGEALQPYRSKVFLAEKTMSRDAKGARQELERTLQRFHTDHVDLYQFHAVASADDVDKILAPAGAAETFSPPGRKAKSGISASPPTMRRPPSVLWTPSN